MVSAAIINSDAKHALQSTKQKAIIQPKLMVNAAGDRYEQEADAMAEMVMRMPEQKVNKQITTGLIGRSVQRKCNVCEEEEKKKKNGHIMRKAENGGGFEASPSLTSQLFNSKGGGSRLPDNTRNFMENAFSTDFSNVRIHTDGKAAAMNKEVNAKAFTNGNDIYFNDGLYRSEMMEGKKLLAHELAHVIQQNTNSKSEPKSKIQRSCGKDIKANSKCVPLEGDVSDYYFDNTHHYMFKQNCNDLFPSELTRLLKNIPKFYFIPGQIVDIHGFASEEGDSFFNKSLACSRAEIVAAFIKSNHPIGTYININLYSHLQKKGYRDLYRAVIIDFKYNNATSEKEHHPFSPDRGHEEYDKKALEEYYQKTPPERLFDNDCNDTDQRQLNTSLIIAKSNLKKIIDKLAILPQSNDIQNLLWLYFRDSTTNTAEIILRNLRTILNKLENITIECEYGEGFFCSEDTLGYVRPWGGFNFGNIHLCISHIENVNKLADILIHEASHKLLGTVDVNPNSSKIFFRDDIYYSHCKENEGTIGLNFASRLNHAASYECFVRNFISSTPIDRIQAIKSLRGERLMGIWQYPEGEIDLNSSDFKNPKFGMVDRDRSLATDGGIFYNWRLFDYSGNEYSLTSEFGDKLEENIPAEVPVFVIVNKEARLLLKERQITGGKLICVAHNNLFSYQFLRYLGFKS